MSSFNHTTTNFDNLLIQSLMGKLQIRPPSTNNNNINHVLSRSIEDLLFDPTTFLSQHLGDSDDDDQYDPEPNNPGSKSRLAKEESKLEKEIIRTVLSGKLQSLNPNSGQAVTIGEHHICVGFHEEKGSDYRVWEWHGHIMLFDDENGYTPEYIYGNYFERLRLVKSSREHEAKSMEKEVEEEKEDEEDEEEVVGNLGLRELIDPGGKNGTVRILHRNAIAGSQRF